MAEILTPEEVLKWEAGSAPYIAEAHIRKICDSHEALRARVAELTEHERQTHLILGAILGTDTSLEDGAKRMAARIAELEADNAALRARLEEGR